MTDRDPETELRAIWTAQGVPLERQDEIITSIVAKAQPGAQIGTFRIPTRTELTAAGEQFVIPGCEKKASGPSAARQPSLWDAP